jgi:hypothetical protein
VKLPTELRRKRGDGSLKIEKMKSRRQNGWWQRESRASEIWLFTEGLFIQPWTFLKYPKPFPKGKSIQSPTGYEGQQDPSVLILGRRFPL